MGVRRCVDGEVCVWLAQAEFGWAGVEVGGRGGTGLVGMLCWARGRMKEG